MKARVTAVVIDALEGRGSRSAVEPWSAWLVVALARQVARQRFVVRLRDACKLVRPRDKKRGGVRDAAGHGSDEIAGMPGWTYAFHGAGLLVRAPDGEVIDVDFLGERDPAGATLDAFFFLSRLRSLRAPGFPESRLLALAPVDEAIEVLIDDLRASGDLVVRRGTGLRLLPELEACAEALEALPFADEETRRRFCEWFSDGEYLGRTASAVAHRARTSFWQGVGRWPWSGARAKSARRAMLMRLNSL